MACIAKRRGKWIVDYRLGGVRKTPSFDTKSEAEGFKRELLLRPIDQMLGYKPLIEKNLNTATQEYLERVTIRKAEKTFLVDKMALRRLSEHFSGKMVYEVTLSDLELMQLSLVKKLEPSTVNRQFNVIKNFFRKSVEWGYIRENPAIRISRLREKIKPKVVLSNQQIQLLIESLPQWAADALYLISKTGLRRGEACSLSWDKVDLSKKVFSISSFKGGHERVRQIPMTDEVHSFFISKKHQQQSSFAKAGYVVCGPDGGKIKEMSLSQAVMRLRDRVNIPNAGLHILRHTILTRLAEGNNNGSTIQKLAGHSSLNTTQVYLHHGTDQLRSSLEQLEKKERIVPKRR